MTSHGRTLQETRFHFWKHDFSFHLQAPCGQNPVFIYTDLPPFHGHWAWRRHKEVGTRPSKWSLKLYFQPQGLRGCCCHALHLIVLRWRFWSLFDWWCPDKIRPEEISPTTYSWPTSAQTQTLMKALSGEKSSRLQHLIGCRATLPASPGKEAWHKNNMRATRQKCGLCVCVWRTGKNYRFGKTSSTCESSPRDCRGCFA